jgi:hypothetical protein
MESHRCEKPREEGVLPPPTPPACPERGRGDSASQTCQHINARGHRCRLLSAGDSILCAHHARRSSSQPSDEAVAAELLAGIDDLPVALRQVASAASVNLFLGNLLKLLARKRIRRHDAVALAYICQLLLNSLAAMNREQSRASGESLPEICIINDIAPPIAERRAALGLDTPAPNPAERGLS